MSKTLHHIPDGQEALYAAAPMLLEAAQDLLDALQVADEGTIGAAEDKLRTAIRHAEGAA